MTIVSKKVIPKAQELSNEKRLTVKYLRESGMSIRTIVEQLNFIFLMYYMFIVSLFPMVLLRKKQKLGIQLNSAKEEGG